jgi:acyl-CoA thioester hydrolase
MKDYIRKVNYHETDKMGITHHSNYIKYMEEARVDLLEQLGYGFARQEQDGIISPVIAVNCQYKHTSTFDDVIRINTKIVAYNGVKLTVSYTMTNDKTGQLLLTGTTEHCYTSPDGRPIILRHQNPELDKLLRDNVED